MIVKYKESLREVFFQFQKVLKEKQIFSRMYVYPSLDTLNYIEPKQYMPISRDISNCILALPIYLELEKDEYILIIKIIKETI